MTTPSTNRQNTSRWQLLTAVEPTSEEDSPAPTTAPSSRKRRGGSCRRARTVTPKLEAARDDAEKLKIMEEEENIRREKSSAEYFKLFMECAEVCRQKQADLEARGSGRDAGSFFRFEYIRPPAHQTIDPCTMHAAQHTIPDQPT